MFVNQGTTGDLGRVRGKHQFDAQGRDRVEDRVGV
jgi:hypothetical protein